MLLCSSSLFIRRYLSNSTPLLQQFVARSAPMRTFQPEADSTEATSEEYEAPRYQRATTYTRSSPAADLTKPGINPFPEEIEQDYTEGMYKEAAMGSFSKEVVEILQAELPAEDIEIKPDGALYLPENRYRRILCKAFGPGGWCLVPRGAHSLSGGVLSREYALYCGGRFISQVRGHATVHQGFSNPALASEVARSNALMRACKDLGIGNELWDPTYTSMWKANYAMRKTDASGKIRWVRSSQQ